MLRSLPDGVPIFKLNEAGPRAKCHRQACIWSPLPTPLDNPPREVYGKGMTAEQSKASAMMEAVERYCGQNFPHNTTVMGSYEELRDFAVDPSEFIFPSVTPKCDGCGERGQLLFRRSSTGLPGVDLGILFDKQKACSCSLCHGLLSLHIKSTPFLSL